MSDGLFEPQERKRTLRGGWRRDATRPEPYDPLKLENLGRSIEAEMLRMQPAPITDVPPMYGAGIYAIYYTGDHELYRPISDDCRTPIYVGKAVYAGGRKGLASTEEEQAPLWARINQHRMSLEHARDLQAEDFRVRYLVAVDFFVPLAEQLMIRQFRPVWNTLVDGFGNHAPGGKRTTQARPPWDELHPGRPWSSMDRMPTPSKQPAEESRARIRAQWGEQR
ncbi:Eco29kI family restriction endonuclease [Streptomyces griseoaurantiacus]|uniref:Eco29kI family restriction endonuclease n=1 Tax=Streptomyces griseoaurantiacus TaxID=68213 RepID=UPI002E2E3E29|nr:Eco29kI family restriction endonuclease [Streptomyces jietaisiensis]